MKYLSQNSLKFFLLTTVVVMFAGFLKIINMEVEFLLGIAFSFQVVFGLLVLKEYAPKIYAEIKK